MIGTIWVEMWRKYDIIYKKWETEKTDRVPNASGKRSVEAGTGAGRKRMDGKQRQENGGEGDMDVF